MKKWKNKWKRLNTVQCGTCDYCCCFEGEDEWVCTRREKAASMEVGIDISRKRMCKYYFPRELSDEKAEEVKERFKDENQSDVPM